MDVHRHPLDARAHRRRDDEHHPEQDERDSQPLQRRRRRPVRRVDREWHDGPRGGDRGDDPHRADGEPAVERRDAGEDRHAGTRCGKELDDVLSAVEFLKTLPHVDQDRLGIMGWSHGGFIASHLVFRDTHPFKAAAAIVPVTNLVFRLSYKGPGYQRSYSTQTAIGGLPFEKRDLYVERSPLYHVEKLNVPILVHVATNDRDVDYVEDQQMVWKLRALKPDLAETKVYVDPAPWGSSVGHAFSRRVDPVTLERVDSPAQIDSWNRTWAFFEWILRPYEDHSKPIPVPATGPRNP